MTQPFYKKVSKFEPHCPLCKKELRGENSMLLPYQCDCGIWKSSFTSPNEYKIIPEKDYRIDD